MYKERAKNPTMIKARNCPYQTIVPGKWNKDPIGTKNMLMIVRSVNLFCKDNPLGYRGRGF